MKRWVDAGRGVCLAMAMATVPLGVSAQGTGGVVFLHPDGASAATWAAARALQVGPDGDLNWDRMPHVAVYRGHLADTLTGTSNGGATVHATGRKVRASAFGRYESGADAERLIDGDGRYVSVAIQALDAGLPVGVVQSGSAIEPGTAVFLTDAAQRRDHDAIAAGVVASGAHVVLGGGERHFLPEGVEGVHGTGARGDGRDLIAEAQSAGYTVVFTRDELRSLPDDTEKVLGLFASYHTFNAKPEEVLAAAGLPHYEPDAPTLAEMTDFALRRLSRDGTRFLLVIEEEGSDNFGNQNNAAGTFEALRRTDEAIGVIQAYLAEHPDTLLLTAADSDGGGLRMIGAKVDLSQPEAQRTGGRVAAWDHNGAPRDGVDGTRSDHFLAAPDRNGVRLPFSVVWSSRNDVSGGVVVRAQGLNAHRVRGGMDNTELAGLMRLTLFGAARPPATSQE